MTVNGIAAEGTTVVVLGVFNPAIFSPHWFRDQGLVGEIEFQEQQIEIITRDIAVFRTGWLSCHVTTQSLQLSTNQPEEFERLRDAVLGVLRLLSHTPVTALGINRGFHITMETIADWHAIGNALTPKTIWADSLKSPGMRSVVIWGERPDEWEGHVQVQVEPSTQFPQAVFVGSNDHFTLALASKTRLPSQSSWDIRDVPLEPATEKNAVAVRVLLEQWDSAMKRAEQAQRTVVGLAKGAS